MHHPENYGFVIIRALHQVHHSTQAILKVPEELRFFTENNLCCTLSEIEDMINEHKRFSNSYNQSQSGPKTLVRGLYKQLVASRWDDSAMH